MSLARFILPDPCLACARPVPPSAGPHLGLCPPCRGRMRELSAVAFCPGCGRVFEAVSLHPGFLCSGCRARPPAFDGLLAAFAYAPPFDSVIRSLKFRRLEYLGEALAAELFRRFEDALRAHDLVIAVPLHWRRRLTRGFNQAEAIARPLAIQAGLETATALRRRRATVSQAGLPREQRLRNPRRAFLAAGALRQARVLLVDDVVTTGATVNAAATALKEAGAASVTVLAAARTLEETGTGGGPSPGHCRR